MQVGITTAADERAAALLRVAAYLSRPQKFMAVGEARAEMRRTLEMAEEGSVVLTTHGEPEAALVPFATLEDMRRALMQLLVSEMEASFARTKGRAHAGSGDTAMTSDDELLIVVGEAIRKARRSRGLPKPKASRR